MKDKPIVRRPDLFSKFHGVKFVLRPSMAVCEWSAQIARWPQHHRMCSLSWTPTATTQFQQSNSRESLPFLIIATQIQDLLNNSFPIPTTHSHLPLSCPISSISCSIHNSPASHSDEFILGWLYYTTCKLR